MLRLLLLTGIVLTTLSASGQVPSLVHDIRTGSTPSSPENFINYNGKWYLFATDNASGRELRVYNPATTKAELVTDANPTGDGAFSFSDRQAAVVFNNKLYFCGSNGTGSAKIMVYDGTNPVAVAPGLSSYTMSAFHSPVVAGNYMFFLAQRAASTGSLITCLYRYDGINPPHLVGPKGDQYGAHSTGWPYTHMASYNGSVYLSYEPAAFNGPGVTDYELYSYDWAGDSLRLVKDIAYGWQGLPELFIVEGNKLYFSASDSAGRQLFSYDGSTVKRLTNNVAGLYRGVRGLHKGVLAFYRGGLYFEGLTATSNDYALFRYDTTSGLVSLVKNIAPNSSDEIAFMYATPHNLYLYAGSSTAGYELYRYDGSTCAMVADLNAGKPNGVGLTNFMLHEGQVYFSGDNGTTGFELYKLYDKPTSNGVVNVAWDGAISAYPNPAAEDFTVSITLQRSQSLSVYLSDVQGKEVWAVAMQHYPVGKSKVNIPLQAFAAGQYFYRLTDDSGQMLASGRIEKE